MRRAILTIGLCLAGAVAARADTPLPDAERPLRTGDRDVTRPSMQWITSEARIGLGWLTGGALRDAEGARGSQIDFRRDLDFDRPEGVGTAVLHLRPLTGWRISGELTWTSFEGKATQGGGSLFSPTPPTLTFDGVAFTGQVLKSELDLVIGTVGIWRELAPLDHARFELGLGAHWLSSSLEIEAVGGPRASERSQAVTPWLGARLDVPAATWLDVILGARAGFLWGGDSVRYHVHATLDLWGELAIPFGPFRAAMRVDYRLVDTHERVHGRDELLDVSMIVASVLIGVSF